MAETLPLFGTDRFESFVEGSTLQTGNVQVKRISFKAFGDLDEEDARNDGFRSLNELRITLTEIYGDIGEFEIMTIFTIGVV